MRTMLAYMLSVLVLALALCGASMYVIFDTADELDDLRIRAIEAARSDDRVGALDNLTMLANRYEERADLLEVFASHDTLHDTYSHIVEARVCFESEDNDDLYQALAQLGESLEHMRAHEALTLSNIY